MRAHSRIFLISSARYATPRGGSMTNVKTKTDLIPLSDQPKPVLKNARNTLGALLDLGSPGPAEILVYGSFNMFQPSCKMLRLNGQVDMLLKRVSTVTHFPQHHRRPKLIHRGEMRRPVDMRKHGTNQFILAHLIVKHVHEPFNICPTLRSEEHTSELQSREKLVCRLLL